jgi:Mg-chelatase subunit ChlI
MTDTNEDVNFNESIQNLYNLYLKLEMLTSISDQLSDEDAEKVNKLFNILDAIPILRMIKVAHEKHNQEQTSDDDEEEQQEENHQEQEQKQEQQQEQQKEEQKKTTKQKKPSARQSTEKKAPKEKKAPAEKKPKNCQFENCESQVAPGKYKFCEQHSKNKKK